MTNFKHNVVYDYQMYFQPAGSCQMEGIISLYNYIMAFLVAILFVVTTALVYIIITHLHGQRHLNYFKTETNILDAIIWMKYLQNWTHSTLLELVWTIIPTLILIAIAIPSFILLYSLDEIVDTQCVVKIIAYQWYWKFEYPVEIATTKVLNFSHLSYMIPLEDLTPEENLRLLEVDNPLVLPINVNIKLIITSKDVIHSFALPALGIKMDAVPGRLNQVTLHIFKPGIYYGQCSELCGVNHAFMPIVLHAIGFPMFETFLKTTLEQVYGWTLFMHDLTDTYLLLWCYSEILLAASLVQNENALVTFLNFFGPLREEAMKWSELLVWYCYEHNITSIDPKLINSAEDQAILFWHQLADIYITFDKLLQIEQKILQWIPDVEQKTFQQFGFGESLFSQTKDLTWAEMAIFDEQILAKTSTPHLTVFIDDAVESPIKFNIWEALLRWLEMIFSTHLDVITSTDTNYLDISSFYRKYSGRLVSPEDDVLEPVIWIQKYLLDKDEDFYLNGKIPEDLLNFHCFESPALTENYVTSFANVIKHDFLSIPELSRFEWINTLTAGVPELEISPSPADASASDSPSPADASASDSPSPADASASDSPSPADASDLSKVDVLDNFFTGLPITEADKDFIKKPVCVGYDKEETEGCEALVRFLRGILEEPDESKRMLPLKPEDKIAAHNSPRWGK